MSRLTPLLGAVALVALSSTAFAQDYSFKFQSSDQAGNPNFVLLQKWVEMVDAKTDGRIAIELLPVGSIVEYNETQDAVAAGIIDGHVTDTSYFAGRDPAFSLIGNPVGAWSDPEQLFDFMNNGNGNELMNELVNPYGLQFIGATTPGLESLVSKVPLDGVADLKGLKIRAPEGLVQSVFAAAGASPVNLPYSEVYTSLDKGVIDAADFSAFSTNQGQGLNDIAKHPLYPGFHSMPLIEVSMNKAEWDDLPDDLKSALTESVDAYAHMQIESLAKSDAEAVEEAKANGVTIHDWSKEERAKFRTIARGEWQKVANKSANAQKVYDTLTAYLQDKGLMQSQ